METSHFPENVFIKKWKIANFKSYQKPIEIDMAPLTLLCGPNSSGKSTIIQSILLITQTFLNYDSQIPLLFNGVLQNLGTFQRIMNYHS